MQTVYLQAFEDSFVVHFESKLNRINAYTLATTLSNLADAAKAANDYINPGYDIEIVVEALSEGSFKAKVRSIYKGASNLFSGQTLSAIVIGVISNFVYQHTLAPDSKVTVIVGEKEVVIEHENTKLVVPRSVYDKTKELENSPQFTNGIRRAVQAVEKDPEINGIGFTRNTSDKSPDIYIPKERLSALSEEPGAIDPATREILEVTEVQILRAILEKTKRKWQFVWGGVRISAPILDQSFFQKFDEHQITIAPGDRLRVKLRIRQRKTDLGNMYVNESYEILEVLGHIPQVRQAALKQNPAGA